MAKIGRNDPCRCGSGKKYKHCCLTVGQSLATAPAESMAIQIIRLLQEKIIAIQELAAKKEVSFYQLGVFLYFSTHQGDAWLLEMTENDAVQIAQQGVPIAVSIVEATDTIEINWSHTFAIQDKQCILKAYLDSSEMVLAHAPTHQIQAAIRRVQQRYAPSLLKEVHASNQSVSTN